MTEKKLPRALDGYIVNTKKIGKHGEHLYGRFGPFFERNKAEEVVQSALISDWHEAEILVVLN